LNFETLSGILALLRQRYQMSFERLLLFIIEIIVKSVFFVSTLSKVQMELSTSKGVIVTSLKSKHFIHTLIAGVNPESNKKSQIPLISNQIQSPGLFLIFNTKSVVT
jgi:hypothetical protein